MTLVCIGDTHNQHHLLKIPMGDVLIHTGDFTDAGTERESLSFLEWFFANPHQYKIFIAGNHDFHFQKMGKEAIEQIMPSKVYYLENSGVWIKDTYFWGSPNMPGPSNFAFTTSRGAQIAQYWDQIPTQTNVLITHTPPYGIMDHINRKTSVGCEELLKKVKIIKPNYHIFGHVHDQYGKSSIKSTQFVNAASLFESQKGHFEPITLHIS